MPKTPTKGTYDGIRPSRSLRFGSSDIRILTNNGQAYNTAP